MRKCPNCGFALSYAGVAKAIQKDYARAFQLWTPEENLKLQQLVREGKDIVAISTILARHPTSVRKRMVVLGLELTENKPVVSEEEHNEKAFEGLTSAEPFAKAQGSPSKPVDDQKQD